MRIRSGPATVNQESLRYAERQPLNLFREGDAEMSIDKSGDLHEKNINPRENGLLMTNNKDRQKYGLHDLCSFFVSYTAYVFFYNLIPKGQVIFMCEEVIK